MRRLCLLLLLLLAAATAEPLAEFADPVNVGEAKQEEEVQLPGAAKAAAAADVVADNHGSEGAREHVGTDEGGPAAMGGGAGHEMGADAPTHAAATYKEEQRAAEQADAAAAAIAGADGARDATVEPAAAAQQFAAANAKSSAEVPTSHDEPAAAATPSRLQPRQHNHPSALLQRSRGAPEPAAAAPNDDLPLSGDAYVAALRAGAADLLITDGASEAGLSQAGRRGPLKRLFWSYNELLKKHYLTLSFIQATVLGTLGDALAQAIERWAGHLGGGRHGWLDLRRMVDVGLLTMVIDGIFTPRWYALMEQLSTSKAMPIVIAKTALSSLVYGPFANGFFLAGVPVLRYGRKALGRGFDWVAWRRQLLIATIRDLQMVSPCEFLNQLLVPFKYQPLGYQASEIMFHIVLSLIAHNEMELPLKWLFRAVDSFAGTNVLGALQDMMYHVAADDALPGETAAAAKAAAEAAAKRLSKGRGRLER